MGPSLWCQNMGELIMDQRAERIYRKALEKWGLNGQIAVAIEEFAELTVELAKYLNGKRETAEYRRLLIDELADARIMHDQMMFNFDCEQEVKNRIVEKLARLEGILKSTQTLVAKKPAK